MSDSLRHDKVSTYAVNMHMVTRQFLKIRFFILLGLGLLLAQPVFALPVLKSTYSATGPTSIKKIHVLSDGTVIAAGVVTGNFGKFSADGNSYTTINYDIPLASMSGLDFVMTDNTTMYIATNGSVNPLYKYTINGTTASFVASANSGGTGVTTLSLGIDGNLYNTRGSSFFRSYDTDLILVSSAFSLASAPTHAMISSAGVFYFTTSGGLLKKSPTFTTASETTVTSNLSSGAAAAPTAIYVSADGTAYVSPALFIKKVSPVGTVLYSYAVAPSTSSMTLDSAGNIYWSSVTGVITKLSPINAVSAFSATPSGDSAGLSWTTGVVDSDFGGVTIRRSTTDYPTSPTASTAVIADYVSSNSYTDSSVSNNTQYYYTIFNKTSDGFYSDGVTSNVMTPPAAPTLTAAKPASDSNSINLEWDVPAGTDTFTLQRDKDSGGYTTVQSGIASSTTTYSDMALTDGEYTYKIFALNASSSSSLAGTSSSLTIDTTPPNAPTLTAEKPTLNGNSISLSWDTPAGTSTFTLQREKDGGGYITVQSAIASSTTTYSDTSLTDGAYTYKIFAVDTYGNISNAGTSSSLTIDTTAPSAPSLTAEKTSPNGNVINLSWTAPSGTSTFTLQRSVNGGGYTTVQSGIASSTTTYQQTGLDDGVYTYKIFAVDAYGNTSNAGTSSSLTIDTVGPNAPTLSATLATPTGNIINLSWDVPSGTDTFNLQRSVNSGGYSNVQTGIASSTTTYQQTGLSDATYTYKIFAVDAYGNVSNAGISSTLTVDTTGPSPVTDLFADLEGTSIVLTWTNPVTDFDSVTIRRSTTAFPATIDSDDLVATGITAETYEDTDVEPGTYYYSVFTEDTLGNVSVAANVMVVNEGGTPTVTTGDATEIDESGAVLAGSVTDSGTSDVTMRGFEFGETTDYGESLDEEGIFTDEDFELTLEDLECALTYHFRAYATNETGTAYGEDKTFSTNTCAADASTLTIEVTAPTTPIVVNANATFVVTVTNSGDSDHDDTVIDFTLSSNLEFVSAEIILTDSDLSADASFTRAAATCTGTNPISCNIGTIPAGQSATLNVTVKAISTGPVTLGAAPKGEGDAGGSTTGGTAVDAAEAQFADGCGLNVNIIEDPAGMIIFSFLTFSSFLIFKNRRNNNL